MSGLVVICLIVVLVLNVRGSVTPIEVPVGVHNRQNTAQLRIANALSSKHMAGPSSAQFGAWSAQTKGVVEGSGVVVVEVVVIVVVDGGSQKTQNLGH